jgi:hypothetical protein
MPKFYVQSGTLQLVTTATDPRAAAIWAVHRTLSLSLPFLCEAPCGGAVQASAPKPMLADALTVSERGFAADDGVEFDTLAIVIEWTQLLAAVDRVHKRLAAH